MEFTVARITQEEAISILTDAIETNSIQYWACDYGKISVRRRLDLNIYRVDFWAMDEKGEKHTYTLTPRKIKKGVEKLFEKGFEVRKDILVSIVAGDMDSECYDCIIQAAIFGELVYG